MKKQIKLTAKLINELTGLYCKKHAAKLAEIYNQLEPQNDWQIKHEKTEMFFGRQSAWNFKTKEYDLIIEGDKTEAINFTVNHSNGAFSFLVPEKIAHYFYTLFGIAFEKTETEKGKKIQLACDIKKQIKKASKFQVDAKEMRPALEGVLIEIEAGLLSVTATNAHILYKSNSVKCDTKKDYSFHIKGSFEGLNEVTEIEILTNGLNLGGKFFEFSEAKFPNYKAVIPAYKEQMIFEPKKLINTLKSLKGMQNRASHTVSIYFNGTIQVSATDFDFANEAKVYTPYISKSFKDCEIGFNSKLLMQSLATFEDKEISLKTDGVPNKAVTIHGQNEMVLCMPQLLNA